MPKERTPNDTRVSGARIIEGVLVLVIFGLLVTGIKMYMKLDSVDTRTAGIEDFLQNKYPKGFKPTRVASERGLKPLEGHELMYGSMRDLKQSDKKQIESSGYVVDSVAITPEIKAGLNKLGPDYSHAYRLMIKDDTQGQIVGPEEQKLDETTQQPR